MIDSFIDRGMYSTTTLPKALVAAFERAYPGQTPDVFVRAPGRVNLLGGHVDMHEGAVINIAINREIWLAAGYGSAELVRIYAADLEDSTILSFRQLNNRADAVGDGLQAWAHYPAGIAWALKERGLTVNGINTVFLGNFAMRAGLSSSAAVEEAFAIAWQALEGWRLDPKELAVVGQKVEREYMRLGTGIQDQFTCLHARQGYALWLDCRTLDHRHILFPATVRVVICDTNTRRALVGSGYTQRTQDAHAAAHTVSLVDRHVQKLRDVSMERLNEFEALLTENQFRRARHVVTEIARVEQGVKALEQGDVITFGALMNESYRSASMDYGSSSSSLDAMWQAATQHPGCYGARYSGGGEGGVVVALVDTQAVDDFVSSTTACYQRATGSTGAVFAVEAAQGAGIFA